MKKNIIWIQSVKTESMGTLSFFEAKRDVPFEIKRIYYIYSAPEGTERGGHAHRKLKQILFCPFGKIEIVLDNGFERESVLLDSPSKGLIIGPGIWREMLWRKENSVLCVAASEYYNENDYIRDYEEFLIYEKETNYKLSREKTEE